MSEVYSLFGFAEPVSCITHLAAAIVFVWLNLSLLRRHGTTPGRALCIIVYGLGCFTVLAASGVYHFLPREEAARAIMQQIDHAAIFLMIAGTCTPVHAVHLKSIGQKRLLAALWAAAIAGIAAKILFFDSIPEALGLSLYLALGWLGVCSAIALWRKYGFSFVRTLLYGGLAYTLGAFLDFFHYPVLITGIVGPHEVFHVAVLLGMTWHWLFINSALRVEQSAVGVDAIKLEAEFEEDESDRLLDIYLPEPALSPEYSESTVVALH